MSDTKIRYDGHDYTVPNQLPNQVRETVLKLMDETQAWGPWFEVRDGDTEVNLLLRKGISIAVVG